MKQLLCSAAIFVASAATVDAEVITLDFEAEVSSQSFAITQPLGPTLTGFLTYDTSAGPSAGGFRGTIYDALTVISVTIPTTVPTTFSYTGSQLRDIVLVNDEDTFLFPPGTTSGEPSLGDQIFIAADGPTGSAFQLNIADALEKPNIPDLLSNESIAGLEAALTMRNYSGTNRGSISFFDQTDFFGPGCEGLGSCQIRSSITSISRREMVPIPGPSAAILLLSALGLGVAAQRRAKRRT